MPQPSSDADVSGLWSHLVTGYSRHLVAGNGTYPDSRAVSAAGAGAGSGGRHDGSAVHSLERLDGAHGYGDE